MTVFSGNREFSQSEPSEEAGFWGVSAHSCTMFGERTFGKPCIARRSSVVPSLRRPSQMELDYNRPVPTRGVGVQLQNVFGESR